MRKEEIENHKVAARKLNVVKDGVLAFIGRNIGKVSEYEVNEFIAAEFKKEGLITQKECPTQIVAFGQNTSYVHYYPNKNNSKIIEKNDLVLIDIWARLEKNRSPFADITWMAYCGHNIPEEIKNAFDKVIGARSAVLNSIKGSLEKRKFPKTKDVDGAAKDYFKRFKLDKYFLHGAGHSLGFTKDHGNYFRFSQKSKSELKPNIPFTVEPGIYFKNKFGIRSEIDCYVDENYQLVITSEIQKEITKI